MIMINCTSKAQKCTKLTTLELTKMLSETIRPNRTLTQYKLVEEKLLKSKMMISNA